MKYDARACHFNMDTGCVELLLRDGRKISIDCTGVEDALDATIAQRSELDYLIYNDPLAYADLILDFIFHGYLHGTCRGKAPPSANADRSVAQTPHWGVCCCRKRKPPINKKRTRTLFHKESGSSTNCMVGQAGLEPAITPL